MTKFCLVTKCAPHSFCTKQIRNMSIVKDLQKFITRKINVTLLPPHSCNFDFLGTIHKKYIKKKCLNTILVETNLCRTLQNLYTVKKCMELQEFFFCIYLGILQNYIGFIYIIPYNSHIFFTVYEIGNLFTIMDYRSMVINGC